MTRASGLVWHNKLDVVWGIYFQTVAAEISVILAAMTAFRAIFVSRTAPNQDSPRNRPSVGIESKFAMRRLLDPRRWMSNHPREMARIQKHDIREYEVNRRFPSIPGAAMTGMQTFIDHQGEATRSEIEPTSDSISTEANHDTSPFSKYETVSASLKEPWTVSFSQSTLTEEVSNC